MSDCLFCKIIQGEIPSTCVYEDEYCYAFEDIEPAAPSHILLVPKKHITSLNNISEEDAPLLGHLMFCASQIAQKAGIASNGYRVVINCGADGGQTVEHLHLHILGGRQLAWPPG